MGERITGGGDAENGMHEERGSEGKNGHIYRGERIYRACEQKQIKTINNQNKEHTITHLSFRNSTLHQNSLRFHIGLFSSAEPRYYISFPVCVVFTVFFQSD